MTEFGPILRALADGQVDFIIIGGIAAGAHGAARATYDVDAVYDRAPQNIGRLADALKPLHPYLRGAPPGLPFTFDAETIQRGLNFTLTTDVGAVDLLGELTGGGRYGDLLSHSSERQVLGVRARVLSLPMLIHVKRAAGRPKDFEAIAELEILLTLTNGREG
jgi:hypothetical protein